MASLARRFKPLFDRVLISKAVPETVSQGGILLPTAATKTTNEGTVVAVGEGSRTMDGAVVPIAVSEGDKVLLPDYGGVKIELGGEDYFIFRDSDILGKFD
eukprot:m.95088 g.95088  ORF g.95088 m.95088 type:complete len:101 (-) comp26786_c0_seq1:203-505(-)